MEKKKMAAAAVLALSLTGCVPFATPPPPPPAHIKGTVQDIHYAFNYQQLQYAWSAQLLVSPDYNGAPNVNIANSGNSDCIFRNFVHDGDTLSITAKSSGSFGDLAASDVTDVTTGHNLADYSDC